MNKLIFFVYVVAAACGSSKSAAPPMATDPPSCESAVRSAAQRIGVQKPVPERDISDAVSDCTQERWTDIVRTCVAAADTSERYLSCISGREVEPGSLAPRRNEAELNLNFIAKSNKSEFMTNGRFIVGQVELTPAQPCCELSPTRKCPATPANWHGQLIWDSLDFEVTEDHYFRYSYQSDGTSFEARAVADLDCDGTTVTWTMRGESAGGTPTFTLTKPDNLD